jgi:hypothetical protein
LRQISLKGNRLSEVSELESNPKLADINLANNMIEHTGNLKALMKLRNLKTLNLKDNCIQDSDGILSFFKEIPTLTSLDLRGNPAIEEINYYR